MSKSYHEIMEKIEVTDEMRTHILNNVSRQVSNTSHKVVTFPPCAKYWILVTRWSHSHTCGAGSNGCHFPQVWE